MQKRVFRGAMLIALLSALFVALVGAISDYVSAGRETESRLWQEARLLAALSDALQEEEAFLNAVKSLPLTERVTWLDEDGVVRYDNQSDASSLESHLEREEIQQAQETGEGWSRRYSETLLNDRIYVACRLGNGGYVRVSTSLATVGGRLWAMAWPLALAIAVVIALTAALSRRWTRALVAPMNRIDLENPLQGDAYDELAPMLRRLADQKERLESQLREIGRRRDERDAIIEHMKEGLLLLDQQGHVLLMNDSARRILRTETPVDGRTPLSAYHRSATLFHAVDDALKNGTAQVEMSAGGRDYLLTASAVARERGLVILLQDVTERNAAEELRKRFSANVSHELRTPLTSISGYAELIQSGMTQPQDVPLFAHKIRHESQRLLKLVEDIMRLSRMDEGHGVGRFQSVSLLKAAQEAAQNYAQAAAERGVSVITEGQDVQIQADPTLLGEMLCNLIENAVKYNRDGGEVRVSVQRLEDAARVRVRDTGIGIPAAHIDHVFERFYRVDGSRSKQTGGTGLGLSIVKHGAKLHGASVELQSDVGVGTTVTLTFALPEGER